MKNSFHRQWLLIAGMVVIYAIFRAAMLPQDPGRINGFSHDGAYLTIVARNLAAGKGFVLDALWLVFLQPARLPMPFHNANPLFPIVEAGAIRWFGIGAGQSGFLVSGVSSALLIVALMFLLKHYLDRPFAIFGAAVLVALFPSIWHISWTNVTDELWLALMIAGAASVVATRRGTGSAFSAAAVAGVFLGLAWLTRSAASSALPAIGLWLLLVHGWRKAAVCFALLSVTAVAVSTPWLIHTKRVWGSPLRSDVPILTAAHVYSARIDDLVIRVFHMPDAPPPILKDIQDNPTLVMNHTIHGVWPVWRVFIRDASNSSRLAAVLLFLLTAGLILRSPAVLRSPDFLASGLYLLSFAAFLTLGGKWTEGRYFIMFYALFAAWLWVSIYRVWSEFRGGQRGGFNLAILGLGLVYLVLTPKDDYRIAAFNRTASPEFTAYLNMADLVDRTIAHGAPVIVGDHPYFYTYETGSQALCIPESDDRYLVEYMHKYHAGYILLTGGEREFWRPAWTSESALPPGLSLREKQGDFYVYALSD